VKSKKRAKSESAKNADDRKATRKGKTMDPIIAARRFKALERIQRQIDYLGRCCECDLDHVLHYAGGLIGMAQECDLITEKEEFDYVWTANDVVRTRRGH